MESIQSSREKALAELEELRSKSSASDAQFAAQLEEAQTTAAGEQPCVKAARSITRTSVHIPSANSCPSIRNHQSMRMNPQNKYICMCKYNCIPSPNQQEKIWPIYEVLYSWKIWWIGLNQ